jgi:hypothetical protein
MRFTALRAALAAVGACVLAACAQTMVNFGPSAVAPAISWIVQVVDSGDSKTVSGSGSVTVPRGGSIRVFIHAKSASGVKTLTDGQFIDADWTCVSGDIGQNMDALLAGGTVSQTPDAQNNVDLDLVLFQVFDVGFSCNSGFHYSGGAISLNAKATNFAGKSKSASLTIKVSN